MIDLPDLGLHIAGVSSPATPAATFPVLDPANGSVVAEVSDASVADAIRAVEAASDSLSSFAALSPRARGEILRRAFELMIEQKSWLANLIVAENGKAFADADAEITYAAEYFRWFSEEAVRIPGSIGESPAGTNKIMVMHQPIGVSVLVTPWNFPAAMLTRKIAPALAAGCTVVCKPAEDTPLTALAIAEILREAGAPPGVVNVLPTSAPAPLVSALLADERVRKLSFTGSTETGRALLSQAARRVVSVSMELGGNAPFIVFGDADVDVAVAGALLAKLRNGGEACTAANRFYVEESIHDDFAARLAAAMSTLKVGPGTDDTAAIGPLINSAAVEKVSSLVTEAVAGGAKVLIGGEVPAGAGYFYPPTVLVGVADDAALLKTEIFGPVAPIRSFTTEDDVVKEANDTEHGLVAYVYTRDIGRGLRVAERLEVGMVALNRGLVSDPAAPFGGIKQSGLGREGGSEGIREYLEAKYIALEW